MIYLTYINLIFKTSEASALQVSPNPTAMGLGLNFSKLFQFWRKYQRGSLLETIYQKGSFWKLFTKGIRFLHATRTRTKHHNMHA